MRRKPKLRFTSEEKVRAKRTRAFIIAFSAFVLVFGVASVLLFLHSVDYDLHNLVSPEETTAAPEPTTANPLSGVQLQSANVFYACADETDGVLLLAMVSANSAEESIEVRTLSPSQRVTYSGETLTFSEIYKKFGLAGLRESVSEALALPVDRYIRQTPAQLRRGIGEIGDVTVTVPEAIAYRGEAYSLFLDAGEQSLTGDLFVKFLRYSDAGVQAQAVCALVRQLLGAFDVNDVSDLFNSVCNQSDTNFSVLDSAAPNGLLYSYLALRDSVAVASAKEETA